MKERGILFSAPMVRELLSGSKTQTRRIVDQRGGDLVQIGGRGPLFDPRLSHHAQQMLERCPYGAVGDRLWVRETWMECAPGRYDYRATTEDGPGTWRPSIFMPRYASRITLEITGVRIETLQSITEADAMREGVTLSVRKVCACETDAEVPGPHNETCPWRDPMVDPDESSPYASEFAILWNSINGERAPWASNPWVWVLMVRRLDAEQS